MMTKALPVIFTVTAVGLAVLPAFQGNVEYDANLAVLTATLVALIWYTAATVHMATVARDDLEYRQRPAFFVRHVQRQGLQSSAQNLHAQYDLYLRNIGQGTGVDVEIEPVVIAPRQEQATSLFKEGRLVFKTIPVLLPGASEKLEYTASAGASTADLETALQYFGATGSGANLKLSFRDINRRQYHQALQLEWNGCIPGTVRVG